MNIDEILRISADAGLSRPDICRVLPVERLTPHYNGVGPDWFAGWLRYCSTWLLERLEPLAFWHDVEYAFGTPDYWAFTRAQCRWVVNAWRLRRYYASRRNRFFAVALLCAVLCQICGYPGYLKGLCK